MVKVTVICDNRDKRILKCQEGNRIWYQLWLTQLDMVHIQMYFEGYIDNRVIKAWWLIFNSITFSFMKRKVVRLGEFLGSIRLIL